MSDTDGVSHWPDCNWCAGPRTHLASGANRTNHGGAGRASASADSQTMDDTTAPSETSSVSTSSSVSTEHPEETDPADDLPFDVPIFPFKLRRMVKRVRRREDLPSETAQHQMLLDDPSAPTASPSFPPVPDITSLLHSATHTAASTTSDHVISETLTTAQAAAKTGKPKPTKTQAHGKASCTPSPTKSLSPSASKSQVSLQFQHELKEDLLAWTTCAYEVRDGRVNPDVRDPMAVESVVSMTQAVLYNAFAYNFTKKPAYSTSAVNFIRKFFLDAKQGMKPEIQFGQVVRGPGEQYGQYLGILDFRGMVKVANAVGVLRASGAKEWTADVDKQLKDWATKYTTWLRTSVIGKKGNEAPKYVLCLHCYELNTEN